MATPISTVFAEQSEAKYFKPSFRAFASTASDFLRFYKEAEKADLEPIVLDILSAAKYHFQYSLYKASLDRSNVHNLFLHGQWQDRHVPSINFASSNASEILLVLSPLLHDVTVNKNAPYREQINAQSLMRDLEGLVSAEAKGKKRDLGAYAECPLKDIDMDIRDQETETQPCVRSIVAMIEQFISFLEELPEEKISIYFRQRLEERAHDFTHVISLSREQRHNVFCLDDHDVWQDSFSPLLLNVVYETLKDLKNIQNACLIQKISGEGFDPGLATFDIDTKKLSGFILQFQGLLKAESNSQNRNPGPYWQEPFLRIKLAA